MIINSDKKEWKLINYRNVDDVIAAEFLHDLYNRYNPLVNSIRFRNTICIYRKNNFESYAPLSEWDFIADALTRRLLDKNHTFIKSILEYTSLPKNKILNLINTLEHSNFAELTKFELFDYTRLINDYALGEIYGINLVQLEHGLQSALKELLSRHIKENEIPSYIDYFLQTDNSMQGIIAKRKLIGIAEKISAKELNIEEGISEYNKTYGYLTSAYGDSSHNIHDELLNILRLSKKERDELLSSLNTNIPLGINTLNFPLDIRKLLSEISKCAIAVAELRDKNKLLMGKVATLRNELLNSLSKSVNESRNNLSRYLMQDIFNLVYYNQKLDLDVIKQRWNLVVFDRNENILTDREAEEISINLKESFSSDSIIKGIVASSGVIKGYARHIKSSKDLKSFQSGEILIASGTDFNFMEAMLIASAFITEEGGILSHASVIARELGKPCLIGVNQVYQRIPDGAYIELDAIGGKVEVLRTSKNNSGKNIPFVWLDEAKDSQKYGNKAVNLNRLLPRFREKILQGIVISENIVINQYCENNFQPILDALSDMYPKNNHFIVRSSSSSEDTENTSMAGMFDSIVCENDYQSMYNAILKVKNTNNTRVSNYKGVNKIDTAVLIQPYIKQDEGGVLFTSNPVTGRNEIVIESSSKGANQVVNGQVDFRTVVTGDMDNLFLNKLIEVSKQIKSVFNTPIDIEWGRSGDTLYIFQVRPITTINSKEDKILCVE